MGVSMGGGGGLQMWLADPGRFASVTIISAPILGEAETRSFLARFVPDEVIDRVFGPADVEHGIDPFAALSEASGLMGNRLVIGAARHDLGSIRESNERFHQYLEKRRVPHYFVIFNGYHGWKSWAPMFTFALCHQLQDSCDMPSPDGWSVRGE